MIAVCNTSPVSSLIQIGHLPLLEKLFTEVSIPQEVAAELEDGAEWLGDWRTAPGAAAIRTRRAQNHALLRELSNRLHVGEAAAITLAADIAGALLIIDDSSGRRAAAALGLRFTGTVGVLVASKRGGHIARLAPVLDDLRGRARFWIRDDVVRHALELVGE